MRPAQLAEVRADLLAFAEEVFASLARSDQRRWGETYLRGLMTDGRRKSIEPMAARLPDGDEQCLQQFVNQSPWEWEPVREHLAERMVRAIAPLAFIVDDTGFPKAGRYSVGVARQYSGTLGKVGNCQIGVSISAASEAASCPVDWRLFLPEAWDADEERRAKAHLPASERHREKWRLALEMLDELAAWGVEAPPVVADAGYGEITAFREALSERGLAYVVEVKGTTSAYPPEVAAEQPAWRGSGRRPARRYRAAPSSLRELALAAGQGATTELAWREGSRGPMCSRFLALRARPANIGLRRIHKDQLPAAWLLCEWPEAESEPTKWWLSNLPEETTLAELVRLAKLRWRIELDYRELKDALGLDHFEGRSFRGWHHHVTLVSAAHAFLTLQRLSPKADAPA
ncbi:MAG: IS701 family transposase [Chloroflexi bacterium]|nr:IS701 family transposase [Chloroflexota bacterium]